MASGITPAKRFAVRTSLVTGSTLAVIVGAQTLVSLDFQNKPTPQTATSQIANSPTESIVSVAPNIVILRHPSESKSATSNTSNAPVVRPRPVQSAPQAAIQPPQPVVVPVQGPTIIQASAPSAPAPTTHSSR